MKKFEFIDVVVQDGVETNLYLSLDNGDLYTFTDEEVESIERAEANIERRRIEREQKKVIRARKARRNKGLLLLVLVGLLGFGLYKSGVSIKEKDIEPSIAYEQPSTKYSYKSILVDLLNAGDSDYDSNDYRKLFYLYYNVYYSGIEGSSLIESLIDCDNPSSVLTRDDFDYWYETGEVDYRKLMLYPEQTANMIDYDNIDIYLNFNICLKREIEAGRLTLNEYLAYITPFLTTLEAKDPDIKRVWDYYAEHNNTVNGIIDVKLLCYEDTIKTKRK